MRVGLMTVGIAAPMFMFDTTVSGNHATGHDYGTGLSADERHDLIEYMKTL